jgi:hypothetical protein
MGFGLWLDTDRRVAWAQGTQEYRTMGAAVIAVTGQFHNRDFEQRRVCPVHLRSAFVGFFGSLEEVNEFLRSSHKKKPQVTPAYVL